MRSRRSTASWRASVAGPTSCSRRAIASPRRAAVARATRPASATSELTAASPEEAKPLADRAVETARRADAVLFVGGLAHQAGGDDEGVDRRDLSLTAHQDQLIARIVAANPRTAVILIAGSPVDMTAWIAKTPAVLQAWYGGSEAGHAHRRGRLRRRQPVGQAAVHVPEVARATPPRTPPATRASTRARAARSSTTRACSSAIAGTTPRRSTRCSRSATASATRASSTRACNRS